MTRRFRDWKHEKSLLKKDTKIAEAYNQVILDYEKKGYVKKVTKTEESQ